MTKVFIDEATKERLHNLDDILEVCDESGQTLGYFHPTKGSQTKGLRLHSPCSREELERRRQQTGGRSLAEIMKDLEQL